jgi:hypothetical protein
VSERRVVRPGQYRTTSDLRAAIHAAASGSAPPRRAVVPPGHYRNGSELRAAIHAAARGAKTF